MVSSLDRFPARQPQRGPNVADHPFATYRPGL